MTDKAPPVHNAELQLANEYIRQTNTNIFLTGKAGTGKTTFLHDLKKNTDKRLVVTAPTGVAAINAGGVTLHSFFQMPFGPIVPDDDMQKPAPRRLSLEKINIIRSMDLLVIDEISMVRADLLDGVDAILRLYRDPQQPFGGVQLLMIGDLHQLSPVVKDDEWALLQPYYDSYFFFSSNALRQTHLVSIELKHIYRQSDARFIQLLNHVRDNRLDSETLKALNTRYKKDYQTNAADNYITLTTHNRNADNINEVQLQALQTKSFTFQASIRDDYPRQLYPTAETLLLKKGAQVMFVRNDSATEKLYFNGKIGKVIHIDRDGITVKCPDDKHNIYVEPVTWENIKYNLDAKNKQITEAVVGEFTQFPLRLAWAITIHKSQGLTFDRAIIDAQDAFSHGQVYVALSRCKTFEGMVLSTPISPRAVKTHTTVAQFVENATQNPPTQAQLQSDKILYQQQLLLECFDYETLLISLKNLSQLLEQNQSLLQSAGMETIGTIETQFMDEIFIVADKFKRQLHALYAPDVAPQDDAHIQQRVKKAYTYFSEKLLAGLTAWVTTFHYDSDNKDLRKKINKAFDVLQYQQQIKIAGLESCRDGFSNSRYLKALTRAEIDFKARPANKSQHTDVNGSDVQHPQLFKTLKVWREKQAKEEQVGHFRIIHQRVLIQIIEQLPVTQEALLQIAGIGKYTQEKYGEALVGIVTDYCGQHDVEPPEIVPQTTLKKTDKEDTKI